MNYSEKLKDPRWQKRRLEIFQRDNFTCIECGDTKTELHVHHEKYSGDPWDIDANYLKTLCSNCHNKKHFKADEQKEINAAKKYNYDWDEIDKSAIPLHKASINKSSLLKALREKYGKEYLIEQFR